MQKKETSAVLIADLGYGDAGKGSIVDYLARTHPVHTVVRYNGGAQAAHNVVTPEGREHVFAQFGSATFIPGVRTHLSRFMLLHPAAMLAEERHLQALGIRDAFARLSIDRRALVITPFQQSANRIKEQSRGGGRHGSCGLGIGETQSDALAYGGDVLFAGDLLRRSVLIKKMKFLRDAKLAQLETGLAHFPPEAWDVEERKVMFEPDFLETAADVYQHFGRKVTLVDHAYLGGLLRQPGMTVFEGAQGVLLDEWWGFYPYNSWSTLTFQNADRLLAEQSFPGSVLKLGLLRAYATRHGAGPFVTEDSQLTRDLPDAHNIHNPWQGPFRVGYLDLPALRYALKICGKIDGLVVSHLDRMQQVREWQVGEGYLHPTLTEKTAEFFEISGGIIRNIRVPADPTDLGRQEELTRALMALKPVYRPVEQNRLAYLDVISQALGAPIAISSHGPTALDKQAYLFNSVPAAAGEPALQAV